MVQCHSREAVVQGPSQEQDRKTLQTSNYGENPPLNKPLNLHLRKKNGPALTLSASFPLLHVALVRMIRGSSRHGGMLQGSLAAIGECNSKPWTSTGRSTKSRLAD